MTPNEYLDACRQKLGLKSDNALSLQIECTTGLISQIRKGVRSMPSGVAFRIADVLGLAHSVVWADIEAHQEKDPKKRAYWEEFLARAAVFVLAIGVGGAALPGESQAAQLCSAPTGQSVLC